MTRRGLDRRALLGGIGIGAMASLAAPAWARTKAKVVIIGGGFGGATAARQIKRLLPDTHVTLIEPNKTYMACPFSNLVITGQRPLAVQEFSYRGLEREGIEIVYDRAARVDTKAVTLNGGAQLPYDRLILSPGIDMRWSALEGYDQAAAGRLLHGWKAGPQTTLLQNQLTSLEDGGLVIMSVPAAPYRCPPGPYERASLIAHYLKTNKPKSKLIILDAKDRFSKMPLFQEAWAQHYPDHLEWRAASQDGRVSRVDADAMTVSTDFEDIKAAMINVIPPQKAGAIAEVAGVTDATGWCPINPVTFESVLQPRIHVIGDATIASPMPKSAFSANLQGKLCAIAVAQMLGGEQPKPTILANTCYSYTAPQEAVSIVGVYTNNGGQFSSIEGAGGLSPSGAPIAVRRAEAAQAESWFKAVTEEAFG
ncbi:MAG: NAD(P)/FAD-dependent oxidoreductase [Henriciella sp.]